MLRASIAALVVSLLVIGTSSDAGPEQGPGLRQASYVPHSSELQQQSQKYPANLATLAQTATSQPGKLAQKHPQPQLKVDPRQPSDPVVSPNWTPAVGQYQAQARSQPPPRLQPQGGASQQVQVSGGSPIGGVQQQALQQATNGRPFAALSKPAQPPQPVIPQGSKSVQQAATSFFRPASSSSPAVHGVRIEQTPSNVIDQQQQPSLKSMLAPSLTQQSSPPIDAGQPTLGLLKAAAVVAGSTERSTSATPTVTNVAKDLSPDDKVYFNAWMKNVMQQNAGDRVRTRDNHQEIYIGNTKSTNSNKIVNNIQPGRDATQVLNIPSLGSTGAATSHYNPQAPEKKRTKKHPTDEQRDLKNKLLSLASKATANGVNEDEPLLKFNRKTGQFEQVQADPRATEYRDRLQRVLKAINAKKLSPKKLKELLDAANYDQASENDPTEVQADPGIAPEAGGFFAPEEEEPALLDAYNAVPEQIYSFDPNFEPDYDLYHREPPVVLVGPEIEEPAATEPVSDFVAGDQAPNGSINDQAELNAVRAELADRLSRVSDLLYFKPEFLERLMAVDSSKLTPEEAEFKRMILCNADERFCGPFEPIPEEPVRPQLETQTPIAQEEVRRKRPSRHRWSHSSAQEYSHQITNHGTIVDTRPIPERAPRTPRQQPRIPAILTKPISPITVPSKLRK